MCEQGEQYATLDCVALPNFTFRDITPRLTISACIAACMAAGGKDVTWYN